MTLNCTVAHPCHGADTSDFKTPGFSLGMSSCSKSREERDKQEHHRRFVLNDAGWTCLELMGNCSEEGGVSAELAVEAKTAVVIAVTIISWDPA